jgi:Tfp pilus assembly protein PilF
VQSNGRSGIGATVSVRGSRNRHRVGASEGIGNHAVRGRVTMTSSTRPYSTACLLVMKKSRSVSFSTEMFCSRMYDTLWSLPGVSMGCSTFDGLTASWRSHAARPPTGRQKATKGMMRGDPVTPLGSIERVRRFAMLAVIVTMASSCAERSSPSRASDSMDTLIKRGHDLVMIEDFDGALSAIDEALAIDPNSAMLLSKRAGVYVNLRRYPEAHADAERAVTLSPQSAEAWCARGYVRTIVAQDVASLDPALSDLNQAIILDENYAPAYAGRGLVHALKNDFGRAMPDLDHAIQLSASNPKMWFYRGCVHAMNNNQDAAISDFSQAIKLEPRYVEAYLQRAAVYDQQGHRPMASDDYTNALTINGKLYKRRVTTTRVGHIW